MQRSVTGNPITARWGSIVLWILILLLFVSSCGVFGERDQVLQETIAALEVQQTSLAQTMAAYTKTVAQATSTISAPAVSTDVATQPSPLLPTPGTPEPSPTLDAPPTPIQGAISSEQDMERLLKSAKILLFEDMSGSREIRYVKEALDREGYFYLDVGSAKGWFKSQLLSSEDWDLIIAAAEARRNFGGEYFEYIHDRIGQGAAAIIEFWDLDEAPMGKSLPLLDLCGVKFQADWYEPDLRNFWWLVPEHPVFHQPNEMGASLRNAVPIWHGDIGDLLEIKYNAGEPVGDAVLLAGTNSVWKTDHSTLVTCIDGRLILQTFGSHEYRHEDIVPLWQNYVFNALKSRFAMTSSPALPPPSEPATPVMVPSPAPSEGIGIGAEASCGWVMKAQVPDPPVFESDLFEHHAEGVFLIVRLQLVNQTDLPIQIWDEDYFVEGRLGEDVVTYTPDRAATGYLYIENPSNLYQDRIEPGIVWRTTLVFDVDSDASDLALVLKPGSEFEEQICEVRISLTQ